jgi:hypothetical protein
LGKLSNQQPINKQLAMLRRRITKNMEEQQTTTNMVKQRVYESLKGLTLSSDTTPEHAPTEKPPEGPGYLDYGSSGYGVFIDRVNRLADAGENFFAVGDGCLNENEGYSASASRHVRTIPRLSLNSVSSAKRLARELRQSGITNVFVFWEETKEEPVALLFEEVPNLTVHHLREFSYTGKGITKRPIASNGEVLPDGVDLLAESFYEQGGIPEIPADALYGKAADISRQLETPLGFAYPAVLTAACGAGIEASGTIRPTLYTSLLGSVGSGKSVTQTRVIELFLPDKGFDGEDGDIRDPRNLQGTAASDQGLYRMLTEAKGNPRLISQDEGRNLLTKAGIEGSSLAPVLCQLFNQNYAGGADKKSEYSICVKLSMLLCVKVDNPSEFPEVFGFASAHGLYDRSLFGVHPADDFKFKPWTKPQFSFSPSTPSVSHDVFDRVNAWGDRTDRRLRELALRVAYVSCAINGDDHVTDESITAALAFMVWQKRLRIFYQTAKGANEHQDCVETILDAFRSSPGKCGKWRDMARVGHWHRKFPRTLLSVQKMLEMQGVLVKDTNTKKHFLNEQVTKETHHV